MTAVFALWKKAAVAAFFHLSIVVLATSQGLAADHISQRSWFEDKTGLLSLEQVKQQPFAPFRSVLSRGIGEGVIWVRLRIDPSTKDEFGAQSSVADLYLKILPIYLDKIELFDPLDPTKKPRITGDRYTVANDEFRSLSFGFLIPKGETARDIYLRVETTSSRFFDAEALTLNDLLESERRLQIFSGIFAGISTLLLAWAVVSWLITREALLFSYVLSQFAGLMFGATLFGHLRYLLGDSLGPSAVDYTTSVSVITAVGMATFFYWRLFMDFNPPKWGSRALLAAIGSLALALVLVGLGEIRTGVTLNWLMVTLVPPLCFAIVFFCEGWQTDNPKTNRLLPKPVLVFYFGILFFITFISALGGLGVFESGRFAIYGGLGNTLLSGILAFAILQYRAALNQKAQVQMAAELVSAKEIAEREREYRLDQDRLLTMLAHELKTPLSVIALALGTQTQREENRATARAAVRDIRDIIDQCLEADTLNTKGLRLNNQTIKIQEILEEVLARIPELNHRLKKNVTEGLRLRTDPRLFRIIVFNMLDNAVRYGGTNEPVSVSVEQQAGGAVSVTVTNAIGSAGLPDPDRVFEKYYRASGAHRTSGTGLGLYLSQQLAEKLGGRLGYAAQNSHVTFQLWIPQQSQD